MSNSRGRPSKNYEDGGKKGQYRLRLSKDEADILQVLSDEYGLNKAEILRRGLRIQYDLIENNPYLSDIQ